MIQIILLLTCLSSCMFSCMFKDGHYIDDNPIEEIAEAALDGYTGLDIDFTPSSEERPSVELIKKRF